MMQASDNDGHGHGAESYGDRDSTERRPLLPQHASEGTSDGAHLRSRRRPNHAGAPPMPPLPRGNNAGDAIGAGFGGGPPRVKRLSSGGSYPDAIPQARSLSSERTNGRGRPPLNAIKSISRIGRSVSVDETVYEEPHDRDDAGEYYFDDNNDYSWDCTFGTEEGNGIWLNLNDPPGSIMSVIVWILIVYSGMTIAFLAEAGHLAHVLAYFYCTVCALALASHAKTMFSDPGSVPSCAVPVDAAARQFEAHTMCRSCKSYKPPNSHHCRICNRCVSRMDHHCPWMNNCIGAANLKSFILFLGYTWMGSAFALIVFGCNYFLCHEERCEFSGVLVQLVRFMTVICVCSILFTSSMMANVTYGVMTGSGTIDRLKRRISNTAGDVDDPPLKYEDIFGIGSYVTWFLPVDPIFPDHDRVLGFSMPQRLLREGNENTSVC